MAAFRPGFANGVPGTAVVLHVVMHENGEFLRRAARGDAAARDRLLASHRPRLARMVRFRIDRRVRARMDEDDVVQEVLLEASLRMDRYFAAPPMPFFAWLRFLTAQRLAGLHRHHLRVHGRDARREVRLDTTPPAGTPLADAIPGRRTTPTQAAERAELRRRVGRALDALPPHDREVLRLRHFEQLTNAETACELGIDVSAASKRYVRSLRRLEAALSASPAAPGAPETRKAGSRGRCPARGASA